MQDEKCVRRLLFSGCRVLVVAPLNMIHVWIHPDSALNSQNQSVKFISPLHYHLKVLKENKSYQKQGQDEKCVSRLHFSGCRVLVVAPLNMIYIFTLNSSRQDFKLSKPACEILGTAADEKCIELHRMFRSNSSGDWPHLLWWHFAKVFRQWISRYIPIPPFHGEEQLHFFCNTV